MMKKMTMTSFFETTNLQSHIEEKFTYFLDKITLSDPDLCGISKRTSVKADLKIMFQIICYSINK